MKPKFTFLFLLTAVIVGGCNITSQDDAIAFNDKIIDEQEKVIDVVSAYNEEESFDLDLSLELCEAIVNQCDQSIQAINELKTIEGGEAFKSSVLAYFSFFKHVGKEEYVEFSHLICKEDYSDEEYEKALEIEEYINSKSAQLEDQITKDQYTLAKKYNFNLQ